MAFDSTRPKLGIIGANGRMGRAIIGKLNTADFELSHLHLIESHEIFANLDNIHAKSKSLINSCLELFAHNNDCKALYADLIDHHGKLLVCEQDAITCLSSQQSNEGHSIAITHNLDLVFRNCDVVIDFSAPESTMRAAELSKKYEKILVSGTTGFSGTQTAELEKLSATGGKIVWSSNMSFGVNVLFSLVSKAANILSGSEYDCEILEKHHNLKKDAPSGTAITLGKTVAQGRNMDFDDVKCLSREGIVGERKPDEIGFSTIRHGNTVGYHEVSFCSSDERIWLGHEAFNRDIFASGALKAAKIAYAQNIKSGKLYTISDLLF